MLESPSALPIRFDEKGISIHGRYQILLASSLFYFRLPRERWEDRMRLLKTAGYNAIDVYFPWNYHETSPGVWNFTGQRDVTHFLSLAAKHELYVIARPGPYICSEWDGGGLPAWLWRDGVAVRQDDPVFLARIGDWYKHILSLIAPFQITRGGSVICMQIENELDFFDCKSPVTYMEKLMWNVKSEGIDIPLFYCCGQNDLLRGGGLTPDLYTSFNVYTSADNACLEERALYLYHAVKDRNMPFLVTETNREHSFLKRLLSCGARLISPYNQTAGSTLDWYNGLTNWGSQDAPLSLIASDYDFNSMIGSAGEVNEQFYEARLLAGLILTLGESLAVSVPESSCDVVLIRDGKPAPVTAFSTDRGMLLSVSNLDHSASLKLCTGDQELPLELPYLHTSLLPYHLKLSKSNDIILLCCNYEIAYFIENGDASTLALYGQGPLHAQVQIQHEIYTLSTSSADELATLHAGCVVIFAGSPKSIALAHIPGLPDMIRPIEDQQVSYSITDGYYIPCELPQTTPITSGTASPMEKAGQYRGLGCYRFTLEQDSQLLLQNVADIFTIYQDDHLIETGFGEGNCLERTFSAGQYAVYTEIWGHSNFDDIRRPSLRMGSLKGIAGLHQIQHRLSLTENWFFDLDDQPIQEWYFFRHSNFGALASIDGYNRAITPFRGVYDKWVDLPPDAESLFLHCSVAAGVIHVYVNGHLEGDMQPANPYMDLSSYCGNHRIELCLRIARRFFSDPIGEVSLLVGQKIRAVSYETVPIETIHIPDFSRHDKISVSFPLCLPSDQNLVLQLALPHVEQQEMKLRFAGRDVKVTAFYGSREVGRLLLDCRSMPTVAGGDSHIIQLNHEWLASNSLRFWCQPMGPAPQIQSVSLTGYRSVSK